MSSPETPAFDRAAMTAKWQSQRDEKKVYQTDESSNRPKYYALDMFPYPSGAGLHVGHPKGYIATDVISRKKHLEGYNVLHPMGFDSFGLPTENYAMKNKIHPSKATDDNVAIFIEQLKKIGFNYDRDRMVSTADPEFYKRTQRQFLQMYHHYFDHAEQKAKPIDELRAMLKAEGLKSGKATGGTRVNNEATHRFHNLHTICEYTNDGCIQYVRAVIKNEAGQLLTIFQKSFNHYVFPGGKVDANETLHDCLCREIKEEIGVDVVDIVDCGYSKVLFNIGVWQGHLFEVTIAGEPQNCEPDKADGPYRATTVPSNNHLGVAFEVNGVQFTDDRAILDSGLYQLAWYAMNIGQYPGMGSAPLQLPAASTIDGSIDYLWYYTIEKQVYGLMKYDDFDRNKDIIPLVVNNGAKTKQGLEQYEYTRSQVNKKVLILDGFGGDGTSNWIPWLKKELESQGYEVQNPNLPASKKDHCDFQENLDFMMKEFSQRLTDDTLIVAHSAGASLALALIQSLSKKVNCILVAPTYYQMDGQFAMSNAPRFEKYEKLLQPYRDFFAPDYDLLNMYISSLNIILSDNDLYIPYEQAKQHFSDHFPRACIVTVHKGHCNYEAGCDSLPEIIDCLVSKGSPNPLAKGANELTNYHSRYQAQTKSDPQFFASLSEEDKIEYYLDTQKRLAFVSTAPINRCPSCMTALANEDLEGNNCERCGSTIERKRMRQWMIRITDYAQRLLDGLDILPERQDHIKAMQRHWIGKSQGVKYTLKVKDTNMQVQTYSTHFEAFCADRFAVIAPDHSLLPKLTEGLSNQNEILAESKRIAESKSITDLTDTKDYEGVFTGRYLIDPITGSELPLWVASYALADYGTGIVKCSCHDERDFVFAKKYNLPLHAVMFTDDEVENEKIRKFEYCFNDFSVGILSEPPELKGKIVDQVREEAFEYLTSRGFAERTTAYRINDWVFSRQRYRGEPIPFVYKEAKANNSQFTIHNSPLLCLGSFKGSNLILNSEKQAELMKQHEHTEDGAIHLVGCVVKDAQGRRYVHQDAKANEFYLPGGKVDKGESTTQAAVRELREELGIEVSDVTEIGCRKHIHNGIKRCFHIMEVNAYTGTPVNNDAHKYDQYRVEIIDSDNSLGRAVKVNGTITDDEYDIRHTFVDIYNIKVTLPLVEETDGHSAIEGTFDGYDTSLVDLSASYYQYYNVSQKKYFFSKDYSLTSPSFPLLSERDDHKTLANGKVGIGGEPSLRGEGGEAGGGNRIRVTPMDASELPLTLPDVAHYEPTGTEEGPLANIDSWINTTLEDGTPARRESNTMPGWAGSSRYWLRYMDPHNASAMVSSDREQYRGQVDLYVGGMEHACRHLIYARFRHKFLKDIGVVSTEEPFKKLVGVGLVLAEDGRKMSKRRGNVINPDDVIAEFGTDAFRTYEMFMGPFGNEVARSTAGVKGVRRFLDKVVKLSNNFPSIQPHPRSFPVPEKDDHKTSTNVQESPLPQGGIGGHKKSISLLHKTIKKVTEDVDNFSFNTAVSALMIYVNHLEEVSSLVKGGEGGSVLPKELFEPLIQLLAPFAPHLAEELRAKMGHTDMIFAARGWPQYDEALMVDDVITLAIQINGKMRGTIEVSPSASQDEVMIAIRADEKLAAHLTSDIKKIIYVPAKICNIVL